MLLFFSFRTGNLFVGQSKAKKNTKEPTVDRIYTSLYMIKYVNIAKDLTHETASLNAHRTGFEQRLSSLMDGAKVR